MSPRRRLRCLAALAVALSTAGAEVQLRRDATASTSAQPSHSFTPPSSSSTSYRSSSTTAAPSGFTTVAVPIYLVDVAQSLLTEYFPSTIPHDLAQVSWPSTVVIGTATYGLKAKTTASPSHTQHHQQQHHQGHRTPSPTASSENPSGSNQKDDKDLAIILGSILGFAAIATAIVVFCCVRRRKQKTGTFFMRRSSPSTSSKGSRFANVFGGNTAYNGNDIEAREVNGTAPLTAAAVTTIPAFPTFRNSQSESDDTPFYTPQERQEAPLSQAALGSHPHQPDEMAQWQPAAAAVAAERRPRSSRPAVVRRPVPSRRPVPPIQTQQNPFASPDDREADDVVSPILPSASFEKANSPLVHYPSMSEVSEFDFAGNGRNSINGNGSGGVRWKAGRDKVDGRHELM